MRDSLAEQRQDLVARVDLAAALAKLDTENLANRHPHPLYAAFYYSHAPLAERIGALRALAST